MEIINLPRGVGKTTYAIIEALKTGCPIIVGNQIMKKELKEYAKTFYSGDVVVYTISEFCDDKFWKDDDKNHEKVIIDELPLVLNLGCDCEIATITSKIFGKKKK